MIDKIFTHPFIFESGTWLGEGVMTLNIAQDKLKFATRWIIDKKKESQIITMQEVEIIGLSETVKNKFYFYNIKSDSFKIRLESPNLGEVEGEGLIRSKMIAWEFKIPQIGFEGFEIYHLQEDNSYVLHAEYATSEELRTSVQGRIWKKVSQS